MLPNTKLGTDPTAHDGSVDGAPDSFSLDTVWRTSEPTLERDRNFHFPCSADVTSSIANNNPVDNLSAESDNRKHMSVSRYRQVALMTGWHVTLEGQYPGSEKKGERGG